MKSLLFSAEILSVLLFIPPVMSTVTPDRVTSSKDSLSAVSLTTTETTTPTPPATTERTSSPQPTTTDWPFIKQECRLQLVVCGGLTIACAFFMMTTLLLVFKLCQLSRRLRILRCHNVELTSTSKYCVETSKKDQIKSEAEAKETTLLMDDQTNQKVDTDAGKVDEDGQKTEEKDGGGAPKSEAASADDAESLLFPNPPEEILGSESAAAAAASSSSDEGDKEEPKSDP